MYLQKNTPDNRGMQIYLFVIELNE